MQAVSVQQAVKRQSSQSYGARAPRGLGPGLGAGASRNLGPGHPKAWGPGHRSGLPKLSHLPPVFRRSEKPPGRRQAKGWATGQTCEAEAQREEAAVVTGMAQAVSSPLGARI